MKASLFLILFFTLPTLYSQQSNIKVSRSDSFYSEYATSLLYAKEDTNEKIFVVQKAFKSSSTPKKYFIDKFSKELTLESRAEVEINNNELKGLFVNDTNVFLVQYEYSRKKKTYSINLLKSNKGSLNFKKSILYEIERNELDKYDKFGINENPKFPHLEKFNENGILKASPNKKFYVYSLRLKRKKYPKNIFLLFDTNFNFVNKYTFEPKQSKDASLVTDLVVNDDGNIYFINKKFDQDIPLSRIFMNDNHTLHLYGITGDNSIKEINFKKGDDFLGRAYLHLNKKKLVVFGYFKENENTIFSFSKFKGVFRSDINISKNSLDQTCKYYFRSFLTKNRSDRPIEEISNNLSFRNYFFENGNLIFNAENYSRGGNNNACFEYGSILSVNIDSSCNLKWLRPINKSQTSCWGYKKSIPYSFLSFYNNNELYLLLKDERVTGKLENSEQVLSNVLMLKNQKVLLKPDIKTSNQNSEIDFKKHIKLNDNSVLVEGYYINRPTLYKIHL